MVFAPSFRRRAPRTGLAVLLIAAVAVGCGDDDGVLTARVTSVTDGDTIQLEGIGPVRLIGIDTPEVYGQAECFGREASSFAKRLLPLGTRVRYRPGAEQHDRYGRLLAYVWLPDGRMLNRVIVASGYAQTLTIPPNVEFAGDFHADARRARHVGLGLWRACGGGG